MTAGEFTKKWFDDPIAFREFTDISERDETTGPYIRIPGRRQQDAVVDLMQLAPDEFAIISARFPPMIWNSLPAVKAARDGT